VIVTFGQVLELVAPYLGRAGAGSCTLTAPATRLKAATLIQEFVQRSGTLKKWQVYSRNNTVTLPRDLAVVLKVKINESVEPVHSKWFEFYDQMSAREFDGADQWQAGVIQEVNSFPTVYDIPVCGAHVIAELGNKCRDAKNAYTIIQGIDQHGVDVYTHYKNELIHGERLDLEKNVAKRSRTKFSKITNITKSETDDYVKYYYQVEKQETPRMLSILTPKETIGDFRRARILTRACDPRQCYLLTILGRLHIRSDYHDNDIVPITDLTGIQTLAEAKQASTSNNLQAAGFKYQLLDRQIEDEQMYNRPSDTTLDIDYDTSPGSIDEVL